MKKQEKNKITRKGYEKIQKELLKLYQETRPKVIEQLRIAYDFGDLRENSEFDAAKLEQHLCDQKIKKLENLLSHAIIVDENEVDRVSIGTEVTIEYLEDHELETFQIVGSSETGLDGNQISSESPMGRALFGNKKDDIVEIASPNGIYKVKVISID